MRDLLIYTGGAVQYFLDKGDFYKASCWRENLRLMLRSAVLNEEMSSINSISVYDPTWYFEERRKYSTETIIDQNTYYLQKADILVVNTFHLLDSPGTIREISYFYDHRKPRIGFNDNTMLNGDPMANYTYTKMLTDNFKSLDEVVEYIKVCFYC